MSLSADLSRREFLKLGAVAAAGVASTAAVSQGVFAEELIRGGRSVSRTTGALRQAVATNCAFCTARCGILGFVEEGKLVKIEGNPRDPNGRGRLCARGHAGINRLYDPDRLLYPLIKEGKRGEGKWVRLSWDQAYQVLEERLTEAHGRAPESLILHKGVEASSLLAGRFVAAFGSKNLIDDALLQDAAMVTANRSVLGLDREVADVASARYILNFGGNPYENHSSFLPFIQRLVDARASGARLVTFDPRLSLTAGRSDEWLSIAPGSDGLVALAMAQVIVRQNLHDRQFLSKWTDLTSEELTAHLAPYSPETVAAVAGISPEALRRIATEFARVKPAVAIFGGGVSRQETAADALRAILLLNALVGNIGAQGGYVPAPVVPLPQPEPSPGETLPTGEATRALDDLLTGRGTATAYVTILANPAYSWPDPDSFRRALLDENRIPLFIAIDTNLTETSTLADLVLPAATYLESWGLESPPAQELVPLVSLRQPVVPPRGESLSVDDILLTLGTRLPADSAKFFSFPTVQGYVQAVLAGIPGIPDGGGLATLREQGVWYETSAAPQYRPKGEKFETATGKLVFKPLPAMEGALKPISVTVTAGPNAPGSEPLTLIPFRPNVIAGDYSANCWWLSEIAHSNVLLINPVAARQRGIKPGQWARITSPVATIQARVRVTEGIHPKTVALGLGFGHQAVGRVAQGRRSKSDDPLTGLIWWEERGNGVNASTLVADIEGRRASGPVAYDIRVQVEPVG